ncbi:MAG: HEPN domain-containing protein [Nitrospirae bacterium]|nr:HEPN domain-containing protein [Nitrospirota bacterium]
MRKDAENYLLSSEYDLQTAEHMLKTGRFVYVIFMCHLAIEKILKAITAEKTDKIPPKTHNLIYLMKLGDITLPEALFEFITKINNASIVTRYPEDFEKLIESYPENISVQYLAKTKETIVWLKQNERLKK